MRAIVALFAFSLPALADPPTLSPEEAVKKMKLPPGFSVRCVAAEPMVRQPISMSFDAKGRLWVLQYLQYPNPAGLKAVSQDQFLRTVWDRVPEPSPKGPRGADRLTILSDPDEHGVFTKCKDVITGLNLATGFCLATHGVYVIQAPYLLYYSLKDDEPVGDPKVCLSGFGMEDTHALANHLIWGPDGWLYGAQGSTVTAKIVNPAEPKKPAIEFQQGVWRYHPTRKIFELFAEGGGNIWGLDYDKHGQLFAGTNFSGTPCMHAIQGAYYVKNFGKHGPLHNPYAYGYYEHVPCKNFQGGHVTCGGIVYQGDAYPKEYQDQYIACNVLSNAIYNYKLTPKGASFTSEHAGELLIGNDPCFRPVDLKQGPDGCIYVADWYDKRANHVDPIDNWDKTTGRIYRIEYEGYKPYKPFDLTQKSTNELCEMLKHPNAWYRRMARQQLLSAKHNGVAVELNRIIENGSEVQVLEAIWAGYWRGDIKYVSNTEKMESLSERLRSLQNQRENLDGVFQSSGKSVATIELSKLLHNQYDNVRAWSIRFSADVSEEILISILGKNEKSPVVGLQMASSLNKNGLFQITLLRKLLDTAVGMNDQRLPLMLWWAMSKEQDSLLNISIRHLEILGSSENKELNHFLVERIIRKVISNTSKEDQHLIPKILQLFTAKDALEPVLRGIASGLDDKTGLKPDLAFIQYLQNVREAHPKDERLFSILVRIGDNAAVAELQRRAADGTASEKDRVKAIEMFRTQRNDASTARLMNELTKANPVAIKIALIGVLEGTDDMSVAHTIYSVALKHDGETRKRAIRALIVRKTWAKLLLEGIEKKELKADAIPLDAIRAIAAFNDHELTNLLEKHFGKIGPATAGEKQARIASITKILKAGKANAADGKPLFQQHCATCHTLHGEGEKIGPDLTTADRKNLSLLLLNVVDPSATIRPEFVTQVAVTSDGRTITGLIVDSTGPSITMVDAQNRKHTIPRGEMESLKQSNVSLMPEKLLDTLSDQQLRDLFAYIRSDPPSKSP